jgi:hypothetical protein
MEWFFDTLIGEIRDTTIGDVTYGRKGAAYLTTPIELQLPWVFKSPP